jgi:TATA-box binding protein (TBP) (component of TFIID and TFIIIB)
MSTDIDEEWANFISSSKYGDDISSDDDENVNENEDNATNILFEGCLSANVMEELELPKATDIYISTKTKIAYLNKPLDLKTLFWSIPVIQYALPRDGIIKKQMKFNSFQAEELQYIQDKLQSELFYDEHVITHIDNPDGRIKFKDTRKISIGISKKDILSYRCKKKSAFYNCFVLILRLKVDCTFKEFHVKVFNTGKLEIPGVQSEDVFIIILQQILGILQSYTEEPLYYKENSTENVLINSNFNCGFYINRETLYDILKMKYNIQAIYDPCSYPGIQCKFYYNPDIGIQSGSQISEENRHLYKNIKEVSFMIFRTGSVLIVGRCDEDVLRIIYEFLKNILLTEYKNINQKNIKVDEYVKDKKKKVRRKNIYVNTETETEL